MMHIDLGTTAVPRLGLGTWQLSGSDCVRAVEAALGAGYRHIDTAQAYDNEELVGRAIAGSGVDRDDIFLTTKVWITALAPAAMRASVEESLRKLRTDHVDLLLLHWPVEVDATVEQSLDALGALRRDGKATLIGVSNYTTAHLDRAMAADAPVVTNQVEYHPRLSQDAVLSALRARGMFLTAYSPLARGALFEHPVVQRIARRCGKSPAQVLLRWHLQQPDVVAIPKSTSPEHVAANIDIFDFSLDDGEMDALFALARDDGRLISPDFAPDWD